MNIQFNYPKFVKSYLLIPVGATGSNKRRRGEKCNKRSADNELFHRASLFPLLAGKQLVLHPKLRDGGTPTAAKSLDKDCQACSVDSRPQPRFLTHFSDSFPHKAKMPLVTNTPTNRWPRCHGNANFRRDGLQNSTKRSSLRLVHALGKKKPQAYGIETGSRSG